MYAPQRRTKASRRTRGAIMDAVRSLLEEGTFHESTVEDVATRAGVSRATLYLHFGTRTALVDAICDTFDENPALVALRQADDLDEWIRLVVDFWSAEEKILVQLYGAAAVDPAARDLVARQLRDRQNELRRLLRDLGAADDRQAFTWLLLLTSFETYLQLRRHAGLSKRDVVAALQEAAGNVKRS